MPMGVLTAVAMLNFFSPRMWSKSMASGGHSLPQSAQGTFFLATTTALFSLFKARFLACMMSWFSARYAAASAKRCS